MRLSDWKMFNWNYTRCRAKFRNRKSANYTFYIVDYDIPEDYEKYKNIIEMRNLGVVKTKYFYKEYEAKKFINKITLDRDKKMMKKIEMKYVGFSTK